MFSYAGIIFLSSSILLLHRSDAFLGWIFRGKAADTEEIIGDNDRKVPLVKSDVQFEMATSDEKFLLQQHITKDLSPLDTCHHLVSIDQGFDVVFQRCVCVCVWTFSAI